MATERAIGAVDPRAKGLLQEAVEYSADSFENSEEVNGATLVEWFSEWRVRAQQFLKDRDVEDLAKG